MISKILQPIQNERGMVVEMLLIVVLLGIVAITSSASFGLASSRIEQSYIASRLENSHFQMLIEANLSDSNRCAQLADVANTTNGSISIDRTSITATAGTPGIGLIQYQRIRFGTESWSPIMVEVGQSPNTSVTARTVQRIQLEQAMSLGGVEFQGIIGIYFSNNNTGVGTAPIQVPIRFTAPGPDPTNAPVTGCTGMLSVASGNSPQVFVVSQTNPWNENGGDPAVWGTANFNLGTSCPNPGLPPIPWVMYAPSLPTPPDHSQFYPRGLNCVNTEMPGASLNQANGEITLPAGRYYVWGMAVGDAVDSHQVRLRNLTTASNALVGTNAYASNYNGDASESVVEGYIDVPSPQLFRLEHRYSVSNLTSRSSFGGGHWIPGADAIDNVYALIKFELID